MTITIIEEPEQIKSKKGNRIIDLICKCSDGVTRNTEECNKIAQLSSAKAFRARMRSNGWSHPNILSPPAKRGYRIDTARTENWIIDGKQLSDKQRGKNLLRIPGPGILEAKYYV